MIHMASTKKIAALFHKTADWFQTLFRNRLIAAVMLLFQGINFILNPGKAMTDMVKSVAMTAAIAAMVSSIGSLTAKDKGSAVWKSLAISVLLLAGSVWCWMHPQGLDIYLRYAIALFAVYTGLINVLQALNMSRWADAVTEAKAKSEEKLHEVKDQLISPMATEETERLENSVEHSIEEHIGKRLAPVNQLQTRFSRSTALTMALHILMIILGMALLFFPFETNAVLMTASGITMVMTAVSDLWAAWKCRLFFHQNSGRSH